MGKMLFKDLLVQKPSLRWALGYLLFILVIFSMTPPFADVAYIMAGYGAAYILVMGSLQMELKNRTDIFLNSLPVTRWEVVISKYLSALLLTLLLLIITGGLGAVLKWLPLPMTMRFMTGIDFMVAFLLALLLIAIAIPVNLRLGSQGARVITLIVFMLLFFAPAWLTELVVDNRQAEWAQTIINMAVGQPAVLLAAAAGLVLLLLALSVFVSLRVYTAQDF